MGSLFAVLAVQTRGVSEPGGNANFAGWELIGYPGPRMFVSTEMQKMDAKIPRSRVTAKQLTHGSH